MKKVLAILFAVSLCISSLYTVAFAEEEKSNEMIPVCVSVPEGWDAPCCWAWADDGTNAFEAWPGEQFEPLDDGWYYTYVPRFVQNIIVNASEASVQTEVPEYVEKFTVHAYVPLTWKSVNLWAWSAPDGTNAFAAWPGQAMDEGEDGWFTAKAPTWVNSVIVNGNEGTVQTADISIEGKELWITVYEDLSYELSDTDPNKTAENITVRAQVPSDWSAPCCWAWSAPDGTNAFSSWPGEALTMDGDWYTIEVPGWINSVIINANEGSVQTADLSVEVGKDVWIVVSDAENATVSYEEKDNTVLIVCVALAVAAAAAVAVVVVVKKKKAK